MCFAIHDTALDAQCIGRAVSSSPARPFADTSRAPFICQPALGGSIDPSVLGDDRGPSYLLWKSDGHSVGLPSPIWSVAVDDELGRHGGSPTSVLTDDQAGQDGTGRSRTLTWSR